MRAEMGYPIVVTPVSQFMVTQAVMNVIDGRALEQRLRRDHPLLPRALRRPPPRPRDPEIADTVLARPRARELEHVEPLSLEGARAEVRRADLRRGAAAAADDAGRAGRRDAGHAARRRAAARSFVRPGRDPLVRAAAGGPEAALDHLHAPREGRRRGGVAPCGLTTSAASSSTPTARSCTAAGKAAHVVPGAVEVLEKIRASGPPLRGLHQRQPRAARGLRARPARRRPARRRRPDAHAPAQRALPPRAPASGRAPCGCSAPRPRAGYLRAHGVRLVNGDDAEQRRRGVRRPRGRRHDRRPRARGPRGRAPGRSCSPASYVPRLRRRQRADHQPRRDGGRGDRQGLGHAARDRGQAVAGGRGGGRRAARRSHRPRPP